MKNTFYLAVGFISGMLAIESSFARERLQACTVTINSSDEAQAFKKYLGKDFDFTELTELSPKSQENASGYLPSDWMKDACRMGIQCDILIISGHFAGGFFGTSGKELTLPQMESGSCNQECAGIFRHPKEVFLFGCNTLADKSGDSRTPEDYFNVLRGDGMTTEMAERIVMDRYGPLNFSNKARMQLVFSQVPRIYGFSSKGPLGPVVKASLESYLKKSGNYAQHLLNQEGARLARDLAEVNARAGELENKLLKRSLGRFPIAQCSGSYIDDPKSEAKKIVCTLQSNEVSFFEKLKLTAEIVKRPDALDFFSSISAFIDRKDPNSLTANERELLREISGTEPLRSNVLKILSEMKVSEPMGDLLLFADNLGFLNKREVHRIAKEISKGAMEVGQGYSLVHRFTKKGYPVHFSRSELPGDWYKSASTRRVLGILGDLTPEMEVEVIDYFVNSDRKVLKDEFGALVREMRGMSFTSPQAFESLIRGMNGPNFNEIVGIIWDSRRTSFALLDRVAPQVIPVLRQVILTGPLNSQSEAMAIYLALSEEKSQRRNFLETLRNHPHFLVRSRAENALKE